MKVAESGEIVLVSCRVMMVFFKIWPENFKKTIITLLALRFKLNSLNQTCVSLKSRMQLAKTIFPDSATFIEKKRVEK
jgi:hypothetical protein